MADLESKESRLLQTVDPNALVQTGPGMPAWNGTRYSLRWSGPVAAQEKLSLYLFGPTTNLFLAVARALLVLLLVWIFAQKVGVRGLIGDISAKLAATIVIACSIFAAGAAEAQEYPSRELLEELNARLTRDECKDHCASISKAVLKVDDAGRDLHMALTGVSSAASAGVPIPGTSADLALRELRLNGVPRAALARDGEGNIWIRVPSGPFSIEVTLRLAAPVSFSVQFPLSPSRIEIDAPGWSVTGLGRGLSATGPVEFVRNEQAGRKEESASEVFPSWLLVRRTFDIAVPWSVTTEVTRMGDLKRAEVVRVPLLAGESPRDASVVTKEESEGLDAVLSFPAGQEQVIFSSEFPARTEVTLRATTRERISEEWIVRCSSVFQCSFSGGARISSVRDGVFSPAYRPFPGEELKLSVSRPEGVPGSTFTVDDVTYSVSQGDTLLAGTVDINVRASRPGEVPVVLPEGSRLKSVVVFGRDETSRFRAPELQVPVGTGTTAIRIAFDLERAVGLVSSVPSIKVGEESFNVTVKWTLPKSRWVLWLGGPAWGPLVMFWVKLLTILALAYLASRIPGTPIGVSGWVLLGVGLIDLPILVAIVPALWFGAFSLRASLGSVASRFFNLGQVGLAMLSLLFLWVLYVTAGRGLSLAPNMLIAYPQGTSGLQWYLDRVAGWIATPWALSLPSWAWHGFMLAWALWVVYSLLTWLPWAYAAWTSGGVWRRGSAAEAKEVDTSK